MKITKKNIFKEAKKGNLEVLNYPFIDQIHDSYFYSPLHYLAMLRKIEILQHPSVDKVRDLDQVTPLHFLGDRAVLEVLSHPSVDKVFDRWDNTPLHNLCWKGVLESLQHPSVDKIKDCNGFVPLYHLIQKSLTVDCATGEDILYDKSPIKAWLLKKYSWFDFENKKIYLKLIEDIVNVSNSEKFILGANRC